MQNDILAYIRRWIRVYEAELRNTLDHAIEALIQPEGPLNLYSPDIPHTKFLRAALDAYRELETFFSHVKDGTFYVETRLERAKDRYKAACLALAKALQSPQGILLSMDSEHIFYKGQIEAFQNVLNKLKVLSFPKVCRIK